MITDVEFRLGVAGGHDVLVADPRGEMQDILLAIIASLELGDDAGTIRDSNGNRVGDWSLEIETEEGNDDLGNQDLTDELSAEYDRNEP